MTKTQTAKIIVDAFKNKLCGSPCAICYWEVCRSDGEDENDCIKGVAQFLINAQKERYHNRTLPVYDKETGKEI